jgi:transposase InsO family protein
LLQVTGFLIRNLAIPCPKKRYRSAFGITRSSSKKGCPYDNAVDASANKTLKAEFVCRERFESLHDLQVKLSDYLWWYNNERMHSKLDYMSPVKERKAGLSL